MTQQQLLLQLQQIKSITGSHVAFYSSTGEQKLTTADTMLATADMILSFLDGGHAFQEIQSCWFFRLGETHLPFGVLVLTSSTEHMEIIGQLAAAQFTLALSQGRTITERSSFFGALLQNTCDLKDIPILAARLHIDPDIPRLVYLIETETPYDKNVQQLIGSLYPESAHHYLLPLSDTQLALVMEAPSLETAELTDIAETIVDMLSMETMCNARVAHSAVVTELRLLSQALEEAKAALEIGKIFFAEQRVSAYASLGIGRLIYHLPRPLCEIYLKEVFGGELPAVFDEETLTLVEKFFENNLNTSEAARKLYIHRNTLIYRLDKIQKETGLDLRVFDDALMVKVGLLVRCYLKYLDNHKL